LPVGYPFSFPWMTPLCVGQIFGGGFFHVSFSAWSGGNLFFFSAGFVLIFFSRLFLPLSAGVALDPPLRPSFPLFLFQTCGLSGLLPPTPLGAGTPPWAVFFSVCLVGLFLSRGPFWFGAKMAFCFSLPWLFFTRPNRLQALGHIFVSRFTWPWSFFCIPPPPTHGPSSPPLPPVLADPDFFFLWMYSCRHLFPNPAGPCLSPFALPFAPAPDQGQFELPAFHNSLPF